MRELRHTDPFEEGFAAFWRGDFVNPFRQGRHYHREWLRGWDRGYFTALERQ